MPISRLDLDEKNTGSPNAIVARILKLEAGLQIPIPIERLCSQFDISSIEYKHLDGMEGGLVTDPDRCSGIILVRHDSHYFRQRFTIGHELGHFLIPSHMPGPDGRFLCSREDMCMQIASEQNKRARMEVEANRFSSLLLIPPHFLRKRLKGDPNIRQLVELCSEFEVSKEAMARAYSAYREELLAFVFSENGVIRRIYKHLKFPFITSQLGQVVPKEALLLRSPVECKTTEIKECLPDLWIDVERGKRAPKMFEQVLKQRGNFSITMLWLEHANGSGDEEEFDREENMTSAQRFRERVGRNRY